MLDDLISIVPVCCGSQAIRAGSYTTYIYTYIHAYIHTQIHTYIHTYIHIENKRRSALGLRETIVDFKCNGECLARDPR